jgi:hypothetical protein
MRYAIENSRPRCVSNWPSPNVDWVTHHPQKQAALGGGSSTSIPRPYPILKLRFQDRHGPLRAAPATTVFYWLFHVSSFYVDTRSWTTTALVLGIFLLPQPIDRWLVPDQ